MGRTIKTTNDSRSGRLLESAPVRMRFERRLGRDARTLLALRL